MNTNKFFKQNSTLGKIVLYGAGAVAGIFLLKKLKAINKEASMQKDLNDEIQEVQASTGLTATITTAKAKVIAENLYSAMANVGTDEDAIINALEPLNSVDLAMVNSAFGYREYGSYGSPLFGKGTPMSLLSWLQQELSGNKLSIVKEKFTSAGISGIGGNSQWDHEIELFMRGLRNGNYFSDGETAYVQIFKRGTAKNDPRYVYIRRGDNRLHDDHYYIQDSPKLSNRTLNIIYTRLGWNREDY